MDCPKCQTENPATRKFCRECGAKLLLVCPQCGTENIPDDKFCGECGHNLKKRKEKKRIPYIILRHNLTPRNSWLTKFLLPEAPSKANANLSPCYLRMWPATRQCRRISIPKKFIRLWTAASRS